MHRGSAAAPACDAFPEHPTTGCHTVLSPLRKKIIKKYINEHKMLRQKRHKDKGHKKTQKKPSYNLKAPTFEERCQGITSETLAYPRVPSTDPEAVQDNVQFQNILNTTQDPIEDFQDCERTAEGEEEDYPSPSILAQIQNLRDCIDAVNELESTPSTSAEANQQDAVEQQEYACDGSTSDPRARPQPDAGRPSHKIPLPRARWGKPLPRLELTERQHENLRKKITRLLRIVLNTNNYDSVSNYMVFYKSYRAITGKSLYDFYKDYDAPIKSKQFTCVGLGLDLIHRMKSLDAIFPNLSKSTCLLSCEESVNKNVTDYVTYADGPHQFPNVNAEKEHVMVGVQIKIGNRNGVMIADPGYHVGRVVTVMADEEYPHTGAFAQHNSDEVLKEYYYCVNKVNNNFVEWHEHEIKNGKKKYQISLVFAARPYLSAIEVTEKRNLIYGFRSQLRRDPQGNVVAGYYFPLNADIDTATFTVFIGPTAKAKYNFSHFLDPKNIPKELIENLNLVCSFMNCSPRHVIDTICRLAKVISDKEFMEEVIELNNEVRAECKRRSIVANNPDVQGGSEQDNTHNSNITSEDKKGAADKTPQDELVGFDVPPGKEGDMTDFKAEAAECHNDASRSLNEALSNLST